MHLHTDPLNSKTTRHGEDQTESLKEHSGLSNVAKSIAGIGQYIEGDLSTILATYLLVKALTLNRGMEKNQLLAPVCILVECS